MAGRGWFALVGLLALAGGSALALRRAVGRRDGLAAFRPPARLERTVRRSRESEVRRVVRATVDEAIWPILDLLDRLEVLDPTGGPSRGPNQAPSAPTMPSPSPEEINRALVSGRLSLGPHGLPVVGAEPPPPVATHPPRPLQTWVAADRASAENELVAAADLARMEMQTSRRLAIEDEAEERAQFLVRRGYIAAYNLATLMNAAGESWRQSGARTSRSGNASLITGEAEREEDGRMVYSAAFVAAARDERENAGVDRQLSPLSTGEVNGRDVEVVLQAYIAAGLETLTLADRGRELAPSTLPMARADVVSFIQLHSPRRATLVTDEEMGHNLWLARNGGPGSSEAFSWDEWGAEGRGLAAAARSLRPRELYVGPDGKIYIRTRGLR